MKLFLSWLGVILWGGLIFYLSSIPKSELEILGVADVIITSVGHFIMFFVLCVLLLNALRRSFLTEYRRIAFWSVFLSCVYAILDEYHQIFVPGRTFSVVDLLIDFIGATCGSIVYRRFIS